MGQGQPIRRICMMKKMMSTGLAAALVLSMAACGGNSTGSATADTGSAGGQSTAADAQSTASSAEGATAEFVIGGMGPLTGSAASYGISVKQGSEIAIKEINEAGGVNVGGTVYSLKLEFADDEATEDKAVSAYNSLMDKNIQALVGATTTGCCMAIADLTMADNLLAVTPSGSGVDCVKNPNAFRICFTDTLQGNTLAEFAMNDMGVKNVAVLYSNSSDYGTGIKDGVVSKVEELGGTVVAEEAFGDADVDFNSQLTKIKGTDAEVIIVCGYYQAATYITKQAADMGLDIPFLGSDGWDGVLGTVTDASTVEGAIFLSSFFSADTQENVANFVSEYEAAYNATPDQFAADAYDAVYVIKAAMEKAGSIESDAMIAAMTEISVDGLTGDGISFTPEGEPNKGAKFIQIKDGAYTVYGSDSADASAADESAASETAAADESAAE